MNPESTLEYDLPSFIGFMLESICYGIYLVIFTAFVRIRLKTTINGSKILLYLVTANFIACTAYLAVDVIANQTVVSSRVILASNALYTCVDFISQLILIYRCWIMWRSQLWVMVFPILLTLAFFVISITVLADPSLYKSESQAKYLALVLSFLSLSLVENALVTGLIIFKILTVYREIQGLENRVGYANGLQVGRRASDIFPIVPMLIESGMITFVAQFVQILMFKFNYLAYPIIAGPVVQLYGISTAIVLVRVEMGLSYDVDNKTSKTTLRFAASERSKDDLNLFSD